MSAALTPGFWAAERIHGATGDEASFAVVGLTDAGNDTRTIALVGGPHAEGDAHLMADAPEMLEALRVIAAQSIGPDWTVQQAFDFIRLHAREAYRKATRSAA